MTLNKHPLKGFRSSLSWSIKDCLTRPVKNHKFVILPDGEYGYLKGGLRRSALLGEFGLPMNRTVFTNLRLLRYLHFTKLTAASDRYKRAKEKSREI